MENEMEVLYTAISWMERIGIQLICSIATIIIAKILLRVIKKVLTKVEQKYEKFTPLMLGFLIKLIQVLIWILAILVVLGFWGINLTPVIAGLGVTGVVLGFALQESISSIFSGMMLAINQPFGIGDYVDIG